MPRHLPSWLRMALGLLLISQAILPYRSVLPLPVALATSSDFVSTASAAQLPSSLLATTPFRAAPAALPAANLNLSLDLNLNLTVDPPWAAPGEVVTFTVTAANPIAAVLPSFMLTDTLPDGLVYVAQSAVGFDYDPSAKQLTWVAGDLSASAIITGSFQARMQGLAIGETLTNTVTASSPALAAVTAAASVTVVPPAADETSVTAEAGGWLRATDGRALLHTPPGAVEGAARLRYSLQPAQNGLVAVFALAVATDAGAAGGAVRFGQPAELRVRIGADEAPRGWRELRLLAWDESAGAWRSLATTADPTTNSVAAPVYGGGVYAAASGGPTYGVTLLPSLKAFTSDLWSAAANVGYDLEVPAGPAGLGLNLRLTYNSQGSNILEQVAGSAYQAQASWVGLGWDLAGIGSISRPLGKTGPYNLSFGGGAFEIKESGGVLTTDPQGFLKLEHSGGLAWNTQPWTVRTPDGMKYTFGNPAGAVGSGTAYEAFWTDWGVNCGVRGTQWGLTGIEDPAGNRWDVAWAHETKAVNNGCTGDAGQYTRASYPYTLTLTPKNSAATVRVRLVREPRTDKNVCKYSDPYQISSFGDGRLKQVFVEAYTAAGAWQLVRRYDLGYTYDSTTLNCGADPGSGNHALLTSLTQYGADGATALPAYTFGYQGGGNSVRLRTANNGYGGAVQFNYSPEFVANNAGCTSYQWQVVSSQVITNGTAAGLGLFSTAVYTPTGAYAYVTPVGCNNGAEIPRDNYEFLGHTAVQEIVKDAAGQAVTQRSHSYSYQYNASAGKPDPRKGKETLVVTTQPGGSELARTATEWITQTISAADWPYVNAVTRTLGSATSLTRYAYTTANQNGGQYGNVTHVREYASASDPTPYRTTERWYYPRNDASYYVVNRVAQEKLWAGDSGGACQSQTRQIYDTTGFNQQQTPPTQGLLKEVWQAQTCDGANQSDWVRPALYNYDLYGNRTAETNAAGATTTTAYETTFKTYPATQTTTPGAGGGATLTTTLKYYGVTGAEGNGSGLAGQLQSRADPNSAAIRLAYDVFGRVTELRQPGAGWTNPATEQYAYSDSPAPLAVQHSLRDDANGDTYSPATYLADWTFYDGLGQVIQTQREAAVSSDVIVTRSRFAPLGVISQTVPFTVTATPGVYLATAGWNQPATRTAYDGLGRTVIVTQTDDSTVRTFYQDRKTLTLDELSHQTLGETDAFGRLLNSKQYSGTFVSPNWSTPAYATALYTYTVRDQLAQVSDPLGAITTVIYDILGRKTQMSDPDMGTWYYGYDALGNLKHQIDAVKPGGNWRATCFFYDGHSRLRGKTYPTGIANPTSYGCPTDPGVYTITYAYDSTAGGNAGLGRRTVMTDTSGSAAWVYDGRGRVTQETRLINGAGTFVTQWGYDAADRAQWQKYPGGSAGQVGEQVNFTYNAQGLLRQVQSNGSTYYVGETLYNALGQAIERRLGSTTGVVRQLYNYTAAENFRLVSLQAGNASPYTNLQNISYTYDDVGNVLTITDTAAYGGSQTQSFSYDDLNRLKTAQATGGSYGTYSQRSYAYSNAGNTTHFEGLALGYNDAGHKHAVTHIGGVQQYWYDANGNVTQRINAGQTITLTYDAENRLITMGGAVTETHTYDGDGNRVKAVVNGVTSVYVGNYFEVTGGVTKTYYYAGAVRVAEKSGGTLYYLLTDHLGSTATTTDASGNRVTELRYYPYGDSARYNPGGQLTTYRFTGQRWDSGAALYFYNARWYDPVIGRFIQADTVVSNPSNPQSLNRYAYVLNNPLRYQDPTGHVISPPAPRQCPDGQCDARKYVEQKPIGTISYYYTPEYDSQPDASGNPGDNPNNWTGSARSNAARQGSVVVGSQVWKYDHNSGTFSSSTNPCQGNGVPVVLGCTQAVSAPLQPLNGKRVYIGTGAVAAPCPHNIRCAQYLPNGKLNPDYDPNYQPVYVQSARRTIIIETEESILLITPIDSGYELAPDQVDLYAGIAPRDPRYPADLNLVNPRAWQLE